MRPLRLAVFLWIGSLAGLALAETPLPIPILPDRLTWVRPPHHPALQSAWMVGTESQTGLYLLRVKLAPGGRIPPHIHPDERTTRCCQARSTWVSVRPLIQQKSSRSPPARCTSLQRKHRITFGQKRARFPIRKWAWVPPEPFFSPRSPLANDRTEVAPQPRQWLLR